MATANLAEGIVRMLRRVRGHLKAGLERSRQAEATWREVTHGPLAGTFFLLPSGRGAEWTERFISGQYEPAMLAALGSLARQGGVLYDLGAHMGYYSCAWLALGGGRVEAFEPAPFSRSVLKETLSRNHLADKVRIHDVALGNANDQANLFIDEADIGAASAAFIDTIGGTDTLTKLAGSRLPGARKIVVPLRRLEDFAIEMDLPAPSVIKIDVEGAEAHVLAGAQRILSECGPIILCEVHTVEAGVELADHMAKIGYELKVLGRNVNELACMWSPSD